MPSHPIAIFRDFKQRSKQLVKWINSYFPTKDVKILDCGCGGGVFGKFLLERGYTFLIGVDINKDSLKLARQYIKVLCMDCHDLHSLRITFDVIIAMNVIEHLERPHKFLEAIKRILSRKGIAIFSVPNTTWIRKIFRSNLPCPEHLHYWDFYGFRQFLAKNGFEVIDAKPVGRFPFLWACQTFMVLCWARI